MIALMPAPRNHVGLAVACGLAASLGLIALVMLRGQKIQASRGAGHVDAMRDKTLKDTFPASDPPASQFFDIPVNRL